MLASTEINGTYISIAVNQASDKGETSFCDAVKSGLSFLAGYIAQNRLEYSLDSGLLRSDWSVLAPFLNSGDFEAFEMFMADKYLDGEAYYFGKYIADMVVAYTTKPAAMAKDFMEY